MLFREGVENPFLFFSVVLTYKVIFTILLVDYILGGI